MDIAECSIFAHGEQNHVNGKNYNRKPLIRRKKKIIEAILRWWVWRREHAYILVQKYLCIGPLTSNALEQIHSIIPRIFKYLRWEGIGFDRLPCISTMQRLAINRRRIEKLLTTYRREIFQKYPTEFKMLKEFQKGIEQLCDFQHIHQWCDNFGQCIMYFPDASTDIGDYTDHLNWRECIKKITKLTYPDKNIIWNFIVHNEERMITNKGKIKSKKVLEDIANVLNRHVTWKELQHIISNQWAGKHHDSSDESLDEEEEEKKDENEDFDIENTRKLSSKQKKAVSFSVFIICLFNLIYLINIINVLSIHISDGVVPNQNGNLNITIINGSLQHMIMIFNIFINIDLVIHHLNKNVIHF